MLISLYSAVVFAMASGCSHEIVRREAPSCQGLDWWELGRTEGVTGTPLAKALKDSRAHCDTTRDTVDLELFTNGHEAGLVEYCSPAQGLAAGRSGLAYENACPPYLEPAFLKQYETGRKVRTMEFEHTSIGPVDSTFRSL